MQYLTTSEIAKVFRTTTTTVVRWILDGKLVAIRPGGRWLVTEDSFQGLMRELAHEAATRARQ